jgi:hypothetical protein
MPYSTKADLRIGDIRLPDRLGDGSAFVQEAADEIDAQIGHIYVTPIVLLDVPENRPARLLLKKINNLIASGRLILDLAAAAEDQQLHAYGYNMLKEGLALLGMIQRREILLTGADELDLDGDGEKSPTGPMIYNEDPESLVKGYYSPGSLVIGAGEPLPYPYGSTFPQPYGSN